MIVHRNCDVDAECDCADEGEAAVVVVEIAGQSALMQRETYDLLAAAGVELPLSAVIFPPAHHEFGAIEI